MFAGQRDSGTAGLYKNAGQSRGMRDGWQACNCNVLSIINKYLLVSTESPRPHQLGGENVFNSITKGSYMQCICVCCMRGTPAWQRQHMVLGTLSVSVCLSVCLSTFVLELQARQLMSD